MANSAAVHVVTTTRTYKGRTYKAHLLRHSYREGGKVKNETLGNISALPDHVVDTIRRALRGTPLSAPDEIFEITRSWHHGHVQAVLTAIDRLDFEELLGSGTGRERQLVKAMVAARVLDPQSKLATTRAWGCTTLPAELGVAEATEDDLYDAMDWLLKRQDRVQQQLAARHLDEGSQVMYDLTSTYFEGKSCPLAAHGYSRDGKPGKLQVNFGLVANREGCPIAVSVHKGNVADPDTLLPELKHVREVLGVNDVVLVGDRGMITQTQIDALWDNPSVDWITALRSASIRRLHADGTLQMGLFDRRNLFELRHPDFPDERLIACRNTELAKLRAHKRTQLIGATRGLLDRLQRRVERGGLKDRGEIGIAAGRVVNRFKVAKHFRLHIGEGTFHYELKEQAVVLEAALDGVYVIRTSLSRKSMSAEDAVRSYKRLAEVERAFRSLKTVDLKVRPIHHRLESRVRAHIFLCMLAYYVEWHLLNAWRPLLFADEQLEAKDQRDPVAPARRSPAALKKVATLELPDGSRAHSFRTILRDLASIVRNSCRRKGAPDAEATFLLTTTANDKQRQALELAAAIRS